MNRPYAITNDPIFYSMVVFFALLTTGLPAFIGQPIFLIVVQTIALFAFTTITLHQRKVRQSLLIMALWIVTQFLIFLLITVWAQGRTQYAIPDGFTYGNQYIDWYYSVTGVLRPDSFTAQPVSRLIELLGVTVGSLISAGLIGSWFLVRTVNYAAYHTGLIFLVNESPGVVLGALPIWAILRIGGYAGTVILLAEPLLTSNWQLLFYLQHRRKLILFSFGLTLIGLVLELFMANPWRSLFH